MPEHTPNGAVDVVRRQIRRVRRRKNLYELQRAVYWAAAAGTGAAIVLLPLALFAPARLFAIVSSAAFAVLTGIGLMLAGRARRRWIGAAHAIAWIEARSRLAGRLRTLVELAPRPQGFFHPLLESEVTRDLDAWTPRRIVPRAVPRGALATALVAIVALVVIARLASFAPPPAPALAFSDAPLAGERDASADDAAVGERVVVAPGVPRDDADEPAPVRDDTPSSLASFSSRLQENVRQQVWGKAWERVRDALARAGTSGRGDAEGDGDDAAELAANDLVDAESAGTNGSGAPQRRPGVGKQPAEDDDTASGRTDAAPPEDEAETRSDEAGGQGGGGAGTGTAPNLFGGSSVDTAGTGSFELALAARMRADRTRGRRGTGAAGPSADPDAQPALAADQRRETAAHRMTVPAAYETVVREVFAHRRDESATR